MKLRITIGGNTYEAEVEVLEEEDTSPAASVPAYVPSTNPLDGDGEGSGTEIADKICRSPVTGMVIRVPAQIGQMVAAGQELVVLESMKMETRVTAPCAGVVEKVHVTAGNSVKAGQEMVELG